MKTIIDGLSAHPRSASVFSTTVICSSKSGWDISTTCSSKSASRTSSRVDLNESTRSVGNLRMNPTVSASRKGRLSITILRTVVSSVAKSLFSANTSLFDSRFIMVDLPTLVYPTRATRIRRPRFLRCVVFCLSISARRCLSSVMRWRMIRRSISNCVSPGPRSPTLPFPPPLPEPPPWRSRCVHNLCSRGSIYLCWASSTCVFASALWARMAKMSRMSDVRSRIFTCSDFSILRICLADSSSSKITIPTSRSWSSSSLIYCRISSSFPCPT